MRIFAPGLRRSGRSRLLAATLPPISCALAALLSPAPAPAASPAPPPAAQPPAASAAKPAAAQPPAAAPPAEPQPPDGKWLTDKQGHKYFLDRYPKQKGSYLRVNKDVVRTSWGISLRVEKEDDKFFYFRVYKNDAPPLQSAQKSARPSAADLAKAAAGYKAEIPESDRLRFVSFGRGLPASGQWRNGFDIADMNQDGHLDIVHGPARKGPGPPAIFLGDGKGNWRRWAAKYPSLPYDYGDAAVGDFNGDGHPDLALGIHLRGIQVLLADGKGGFVNASEGLDFQVPGRGDDQPGFSSQALAVTDWNGDGRPDIIALGEGPTLGFGGPRVAAPGAARAYGIVVYLNQGNGKWKRQDQGTGPAAQLFGDSLVLGDFDGDRRLDLATGTSVMGRRDLVDLHQADGTWQPVDVDTLRPAAYVNAVAAADLDHDGRADLLVGYVNFELEVWRSGIDAFYSRPGGKWERRTLWSEEGRFSVSAIGSGDLDGDGNPDVVALTGDGRTLVFLGDGKGSFTREKTGVPRFAGCRGYHVRLADLDGDGRDEVVSAFAGERGGMMNPAGQIPVDECPSGGGLTAWKATPAAPGGRR